MRMKNIGLQVTLLLLLLGLQACGGSSEQDESQNTSPIVIQPEATIPETDVTLPSSEGESTLVFGPRDVIKIVDGENGFSGDIDSGDRFGRDHDKAGDIDGDGIIDLVVGARSDDDGAKDAGAVYILFMNSDGTVKYNQKISALEGGFDGTLYEGSFFGYGVAGIGDYDGDNIPDIAVSAPASGDVHKVYILHLNTNGTVKSMVTNTDITAFGLSAVGDLNNDGRTDIVAANPGHPNGGAIHLLFFDEHSEIMYKDIITIGENFGGFGEGLNDGDDFGGRESAFIGDIDGDGTKELAVGAFKSEDGVGAIWIISLDSETNQVVDKVKIAPGLSGFNETISTDENSNGTTGGHFGHAMVAPGDLNGDGIPDLVTGANQYGDGVGYVLYLNADKTVKTFTRINSEEGGFDLSLEPNERFARSMSFVDVQSDNIRINMGGGANGTGGMYVLNFQTCNITSQGDNTFWSDGKTLFSNWSHTNQMVTGPLSQEQCQLKAFEHKAFNITTKENDGRCIIKDEKAILDTSDEGSTAYKRVCL